MPSRWTRLIALLIGCGACLGAPESLGAEKKCKIAKVVDLPITMNSLRPTIDVKINNRDAKFILDSGAFYSMISSATAAEYNLKTTHAPLGLTVVGIGGAADVRVATVKEFSIVGITLKNREFLVGGSDVGNAGLLGQNLLEQFDVEYDLATGVIRLFHTEDCDHTLLAYWLAPGQAYSSMPIDRIDPWHPHTIGVAYVNDKQIRVEFDTGAFTSLLSLKAAERAGVKPDSPGVVASGYTSGIGRGVTKEYIAPFASFKIGDGEEIKNTKLRIADIGVDNADMLVGADFFVSHRIFVANREHKLFLSYNGGPVFNLSQNRAVASQNSAEDQSNARAGEAKQADDSDASAPRAAELARRGSALAARRDFGPALADLSTAIQLSPNEPEYYYQRADAYRASGQADLALTDYDHVLMLKQDFLPAYIPRAEIKLAKRDSPGAIADLEAVDRLSPKQADLRFMLAELYQRMDRLPAAIEQFSLWIQYHPDDSRMLAATAGRCLSSALQNQDLPTALSDCNTAMHRADKKNENYSFLFVSRGLVRLRQGDYDKAIADFNDALQIMPKNARALYARAVAESRKNNKKGSQTDLEAARQIAPQVAEKFERYGIVP
ncbi:MAG TPA: aspartyl protease family protein [Steroidobacteraceae bacterium]|nr:aspartyl protease family protein [Steroidobacteraceae bacterium]